MTGKDKTISSKLGGTAIHLRKNRMALDSYFTPPYAVEKLLEKVQFNGVIWECASGMGHISKILEAKGHTVYSSDIREDGHGSKQDFLQSTWIMDNIVTNPPYALATEFIRHGLKCCTKKMALLLRLAFLESQGRYDLFKTTPLTQVLVFSRRLPHWDGQKFVQSGQFSHAWFIWDKENYKGKTEIDWIL